jgi:hypothetical protein
MKKSTKHSDIESKKAESTNDPAQLKNVDSGNVSPRLEGGNTQNRWSSPSVMAKDYPPKARSLYERAIKGGSRKAAIRAHCLQCMGYQFAEVKACAARTCSLYPYRMGGQNDGLE